MGERVPGDSVYVTHEKMNGLLWKIIGAIIGASIALMTAGGSACWNIASTIAEVRQDVAVIKVEVSALSRTAATETHETNQAQYVLVKLPESDSEAREKTIRELSREILTRNK